VTATGIGSARSDSIEECAIEKLHITWAPPAGQLERIPGMGRQEGIHLIESLRIPDDERNVFSRDPRKRSYKDLRADPGGIADRYGNSGSYIFTSMYDDFLTLSI
jgi:hypothetical protein